jgi:hypothetical protein
MISLAEEVFKSKTPLKAAEYFPLGFISLPWGAVSVPCIIWSAAGSLKLFLAAELSEKRFCWNDAEINYFRQNNCLADSSSGAEASAM